MPYFLVPFERSDEFTTHYLQTYHLLHQRKLVVTGLIQYTLVHSDFEDIGMIQLRQAAENACDVEYFPPPFVTDVTALAFLNRFLSIQRQAYVQAAQAVNPAIPRERLIKDSSTQADYNIWKFFPDFPKISASQLHTFCAGQATDPQLETILALTQVYLTSKRADAVALVISQHAAELALMQTSPPAPPDPPPSAYHFGPKPVQDDIKEQIIAEWDRVKGAVNQETFCHTKGIGASTLRAWIRQTRRQSGRAS